MTGRELHHLNSLALQKQQLSGGNWEDCTDSSKQYFADLAQMITETFGPPLSLNLTAILVEIVKQPEKAQFEVYKFLYQAGHRIYPR